MPKMIQTIKNLKGPKTPKEKMMGAFKMEWRIGEEMCGWVGLHHFKVTMIFWQPRNLNVV